jgi:RNA polymerase sigma-70 factor (ECF subfamily)
MTSLKQEWDSRQEKRLIAKAKSGDEKAFARLIERYQRPLYYCIFAMVFSHSQTDDLIQDTFIKVFKSLYRFDEKYPFYPWIRRIAVNITINWMKSEAGRKAISIDAIDPSDPQVVLKEDPGSMAERGEMLQALSRALQDLPAEQRAVFVLRTMNELSYEEIAGDLQISMGTVMSRLNRARSKLRSIMKEFY